MAAQDPFDLAHHGVSRGAPGESSSPRGREFRAGVDRPADARERITVALGLIDTLKRQIRELERSLRKIACRQAGCQALMTQLGVRELIALICLTEADCHALKARGLTHTRVSLTIARKIAPRSYHLLHQLGPAAIKAVTSHPCPAPIAPIRDDQSFQPATGDRRPR